MDIKEWHGITDMCLNCCEDLSFEAKVIWEWMSKNGYSEIQHSSRILNLLHLDT